MAPNIVPAARKHLYTITLLTQKYFPYANFSYDEVLRRMADPNIKYLVAEDGGKTAGFVDYQLKPDRSSAQILGLAVIEESRHKGIGKLLLQKAVSEIEAEGAKWSPPLKTIELLVSTENQAALALYQSHGFAKHGLLGRKLHDQDIMIYVKECPGPQPP